jgi:hypothetical protein
MAVSFEPRAFEQKIDYLMMTIEHFPNERSAGNIQ